MISLAPTDPTPVPFAPLTHPELNRRTDEALMAVGRHTVAASQVRSSIPFPDREIAEYRTYLAASLARSVVVLEAA